MNPGILLTHVRASSSEDRAIRTDHTGFVGVVTPSRWPAGARVGTVVEVDLPHAASADGHPSMRRLDPATRAAVRAYVANGGERLTVFGVCVASPDDLSDPFVAARTLGALRERMVELDGVSLLAAPCFAYLSAAPADGALVPDGALRWGPAAAYGELLAHCVEVGHRFLLVDPPRGLDETGVRAWARRFRETCGADPSYAAVYWPWLQAEDTALPPSGAVAGTFARVDLANAPMGVRVAAANVELRGWTSAELDVGFRDAGALADDGVNPIVGSPGRGLVVWGVRTLSAEPRWRQIPARRIVSVISERLRRDAEWIVFETMRPELWEVVARMIRSRLDTFWSAGLLTGDTAGAEYLVLCDGQTNPPSVVARGEIHALVRMRPISATEFVEIELQLGR